MQICPYCSVSNSPSAEQCIGCGSDLPEAHSLSLSLGEISTRPPKKAKRETTQTRAKRENTQTKTKVVTPMPQQTTLSDTSSDLSPAGSPAPAPSSKKEEPSKGKSTSPESFEASSEKTAQALQNRRMKSRMTADGDDDALGDMDAALDTMSLLISSSQMAQDHDDDDAIPDLPDSSPSEEWMSHTPHPSSTQELKKAEVTTSKTNNSWLPKPPTPQSTEAESDSTKAQPAPRSATKTPAVTKHDETKVHQPEATARIDANSLQHILQRNQRPPLLPTPPPAFTSMESDVEKLAPDQTQKIVPLTDTQPHPTLRSGVQRRSAPSIERPGTTTAVEALEELGMDQLVMEDDEEVEHSLQLNGNELHDLFSYPIDEEQTEDIEHSLHLPRNTATALLSNAGVTPAQQTRVSPTPYNPHVEAFASTNKNASTATLLLIKLDVEHQRTGEALKLGKKLLALEGLSGQLAVQLRALELTIEQEEFDTLLAISPASHDGQKAAIEGAHRTLEEIVGSNHSTQDARLRARCVLTHTTQEDGFSRTYALQTARKLLETMPHDQIWLDWHLYQEHQEHLLCNEVLLPNLDDPVYEMVRQQPIQSRHEGTQIRPAPHSPTFLIGRDAELQQLDQCWHQSKHGPFQLVLLTGEPGSGRSRLMEAWVTRLQQDTELFWAAGEWCHAERPVSPYLVSMLESHLHRHGFEPSQGLLQKMGYLSQHNAIQEPDGFQEHLDHLLGLWESDHRHEMDMVRSLTWYIEAHARHRPTLLILDDLYLVDRLSRSLIEQLLQRRPAQLMMVVLTSPGEYEALLVRALKQSSQLPLSPLSYEQCLQILKHHWPSELPWNDLNARRIANESEGNPRILMAMLQAFQQQHKSDQSATWLEQVNVPSSVEQLFLQRLRGLDSLEQDTLRKAAVIGERFWQGAVESLERLDIPEGGWGMRDGVIISRVDDRGDALRSLEEKQLVKRLPHTELFGEIEYQFQQRMLQQILLQQFPLSVRQRMHKKIAEWLLLRNASQKLTEEVASHLQKAGDAKEAARHLYHAGLKAQGSGAHQHALKLCAEALEGLGLEGDATLRLQILVCQASSYRWVGDLASAQQLFEQALDLSWRLTSASWAGRIYSSISDCYAWQGQFDAARDALRNAQVLLQQSGNLDQLFDTYVRLARVDLLQGDLDRAEQSIQAVRQENQGNDSQHRHTTLLSLDGWYQRLQGRWADALQAMQGGTNYARQLNDPLMLARTLQYQGEFYLTVGDEDNARTLLWEALEILRKQDVPHQRNQVLLMLAQLSLLHRDAQSALDQLREAWQSVQVHGDPLQIATVAAALAACYGLAQQPHEMRHFVHIAEQKMKAESPPLQLAMIYSFLGEATATVQPKEALGLFKKLPNKLPEGGITSYLFIKALELYKAAGEKARFCMTLLALSRGLTATNFHAAALNVLQRADQEASHWGLGILLERIQNQQRLLEQPSASPAPQSAAKPGKDHSTLIVRPPRKNVRRMKRKEVPQGRRNHDS